MQSSERLRFHQINQQDRELSVKLSMSLEIMRYISGRALSRPEAEDRFESQLKANTISANLGFFNAIRSAEEIFIGYLKISNDKEDTLEIGYAVLPEFRGQGFASEMTAAMIHHVKTQFPEIQKLSGLVDIENKSSARILEKYGFEVENFEIKEGRSIARYIKNL